MADEEEVVVKSKGSNIVLIMVIVLLLVILIIGSAVIYLLMSGPSDAEEQEAAKVEQAAKPKSDKKKEAASTEVGTFYPLEEFTVNLSGEGKYLKTSIQLEQNIPELTPELDKKKPVIRDEILTILSSKSYEEISTSKGKKQLKDDIISHINDLLNDGFIKNIYFTDFVIS